jgi:hypothetical protein
MTDRARRGDIQDREGCQSQNENSGSSTRLGATGHIITQAAHAPIVHGKYIDISSLPRRHPPYAKFRKDFTRTERGRYDK